jgi:hypothetical protein
MIDAITFEGLRLHGRREDTTMARIENGLKCRMASNSIASGHRSRFAYSVPAYPVSDMWRPSHQRAKFRPGNYL